MSKGAANSISAADGNSTPMRSPAAYGSLGLSPSPTGATLNVGLGSGEMSVKAKKAECLKFSSRGPIRSAASPRAGAGDSSPNGGSTAFRCNSEEQGGHEAKLSSLAVGLTPPPPATVVSISAIRQTERGSLNVAPAIAKSGRATPRGATPIGAAGRSRSANNNASLVSTPRTARAHEGRANASGAVRKAHGYGSASPANTSEIINLSAGSHQRAASASNAHSNYLSISASVSRRLSGASQQQDNRHNSEEQPFRSEAAAGDVYEEGVEGEEDFDPVTLKYDPVSLLINGEARHNLNLKKHQMARDRHLTDRGTRAVSSERKGTAAGGGGGGMLVFLNASNNKNNNASTSRARSTSKDNYNNTSGNVSRSALPPASHFSSSRGVLMTAAEATRKGANTSSSLVGGRSSVRGGSRSPSRSVSPATARVLYGHPEIAPKENRAMRTRRTASLSREQLIQEERAMLSSMEKGNIKTTLKEMKRSISPSSVGLSKSCFGLAAASASATLNTASPLKGVGNGAPPRRVPSPLSRVAAEASAHSTSFTVPSSGLHNSSSVSTSGRAKSPRAMLNLSELSPSRSRGVTTPRGTVVACDYATSVLYERNETAAPLPPKSSSSEAPPQEEESHQVPTTNCSDSDGGEPTEEDQTTNSELNNVTDATRPVEEEEPNPNVLPHTLSGGEVVSNWGTTDVNGEEKEDESEDAEHATEAALVGEAGANDEKSIEDNSPVAPVDLIATADCERTKQQGEDGDVKDVESELDVAQEEQPSERPDGEVGEKEEEEIADEENESDTNVLPIAKLPTENSDETVAVVAQTIAAEAALADTATPAQDALEN